MVSKADSHTKSFSLLQSARILNSPLVKQQNFFTNHQRWQISRHLDCESGSPTFHLRDSYGISHTVTEFIVENLDSEFRETLSQLTSAEEQQKLIHEYLQNRLDRATPYQVHAGRHGDKLFLRFGDYGLKGGMKIWGIETGKTGALLVSVGQVGLGIYLTVRGGNSGKLGGGTLISSGLSSGLYAYQTDGDKKKYEDKEYAKQATYGAVTGLITGAFGKLAEGASTIARIGWQALGSAAGGATSTVVSEVVEYIDKDNKEKELKLRDMLSKAMHKATSGGIGGGIGAFMGSLTNAALTSEFVNQFMEEFSDDMATGVLILKKMAESSMSSGSSKFATGFYENLQEEDSTKKKDLKTQAEEALQSAFIGAVISGITTYVEQKQKIQEYNQTKSQIEQTQKDLEEAKAQKAKSESALQDLQKTLEQSQQNLAEKQKVLKLQEQSLQEKKLQQQKVQERIEKDQQAISEAQKIASTAEQELRVAQEALTEAQQQVSQHQQAVSEAQKIATTAEQQLRIATQTAQEAQQAHTQLVASIDKDIRHHLKHGYKAKVNGHYTKNEEKIRNAYLQGGKIEWKKGQNRVFGSRETIRTKPSPLMEKYQQAQEHAKQTEQKIQELQSSITQKQTELKIAEDKLNLQRQSVDQTQAELKAAQEVQLKQAELKIAQDQLRSYQQEIQQTQQVMSDIQGVIKTLEQQTSQFEAKLQEELKRLQEVLNRESGLTTLSKEQQAIIHKAQQDYDKFLHNQAKSYLHLHADPVSYVEGDCTLQELIPHIVLVQALNHAGAYEQLAMKMVEYETEKDRLICYMKGIITPEGAIGHHLQLEKREFIGGLAERPHMHWSWNQLVQPNSGGSWEEAQIAILEPLSVFESSTYYKPFGVAPYDTLTFGSHHLSNQSILLVPESIVDEARSYLPAFRNQIVPFNGKLRSAVIHTLKAYYPETWHICDEKGKLIGEKMQYSTGGYNHVTCLRKTDGQVVILLRKEGVERNEGVRTPEGRENTNGLHSTALKDYYKSKRFIGLHIHAATVWIEDTSYFRALKEFKENHAKVKNNPLFAGSVKDMHGLAQLGVLQALELYHKLLRFDTKTGVVEVADYYINEAMYADLVSLFYQMYPSGSFDLTALDIKMIFASERVYLVNFLENIKKSLEAKESSQKEMAMEFFNSYCTKLKQNIITIQQAKEEMQRMINIDKKEIKSDRHNAKVKPSCLLVAQAEWEKVEIPASSLEFNLGKSWPLGHPLNDYKDKVLDTLPADLEQLQRLYWQLSSYANLERIDGWNKFTIAEHLWQDGLRLISEEMVQKVNNAHAYLKKIGFRLKGTKADGNCFFNAFLESYKLLSRKIPLLDTEENKISYLRQQVAAQYENTPNGSKYPNRSEQIKKDAEWVITAGEGDLLANIFDLPIRVLTVGTESVMDMLTFSQYNKDREEWSKIHEIDRPPEYIFIVDLGGHFIYAVPDFSAEPHHSSLDRKEQYRLNIVSSIIQWALQERIYRASKNDSAHLILASRLLKQIGWLAKYQLKPEDFTKKLGDCLFDNIIAQLPGSTMTSQELREGVVQFMREHSEGYSEGPDYDDNELRVSDGEDVLFFENWEQYLTQMSKPQVWATELEIQAAAFKLDCPIVVLTVEDKPKIYNPESKNNPLFLLHVNNNHFKACSPFEESTSGEIYNAIKHQDHC